MSGPNGLVPVLLKVLLLHGGPGFPHDYLEAMESFLPQAGIEMYS